MRCQSQIVVQAGHAILEATKAFVLQNMEDHPSLIVFGVKSEAKLKNLGETIRSHGIQIREFREPDIGNEMTAFATEPVCGEQRQLFAKYTLL